MTNTPDPTLSRFTLLLNQLVGAAVVAGADPKDNHAVEEVGRLKAELKGMLPVWQSIETAPKDNTRILVARFAPKPEEYDGYVVVDRWCRGHQDGHSYIGFGRFNEQYWPATNWMPIPEKS